MGVERAEDHPTFELGGNTITSYAAPNRGAREAALFRTDLPPGGALPRHRHDHLDVFVVESGSGTVHIDDVPSEVGAGDSVVCRPVRGTSSSPAIEARSSSSRCSRARR